MNDDRKTPIVMMDNTDAGSKAKIYRTYIERLNELYKEARREIEESENKKGEGMI
ncbi:MAG: hypothetical protein K6E85_01430 [Lachnospiraceae bacterium]|nr:hypothetical protein [Lachnospiraceae bacterium]